MGAPLQQLFAERVVAQEQLFVTTRVAATRVISVFTLNNELELHLSSTVMNYQMVAESRAVTPVSTVIWLHTFDSSQFTLTFQSVGTAQCSDRRKHMYVPISELAR